MSIFLSFFSSLDGKFRRQFACGEAVIGNSKTAAYFSEGIQWDFRENSVEIQGEFSEGIQWEFTGNSSRKFNGNFPWEFSCDSPVEFSRNSSREFTGNSQSSVAGLFEVPTKPSLLFPMFILFLIYYLI